MAWRIASSLSQMDRLRPPAPQNSDATGQHLPAMAVPSASQATQHQVAWYEDMALAHPQERIAHLGFVAHNHAHISLPPGGSRGWTVPPMFTIPVPPATAYLLPTETVCGASAPPSGLWDVDVSDQPISNPSLSAPLVTATSASSSAASATSAISGSTL